MAQADAAGPAWRPASEAEAAGNGAALIEWLRATGRRPQASPEDVRAWRRREPEAFLAAIGAFCALSGADAADPGLLEALGGHLLDLETRPGDAVAWAGAADDCWPRAARALGATVIRPADADPDASGTPPRSCR